MINIESSRISVGRKSGPRIKEVHGMDQNFHPDKGHTRPQVLRRKQVMGMVSLSSTTIWRLEKAGKFPKGIPLSTRVRGYLESDIIEWLQERAVAAAS
jgi:prophage regulatory protein